jgi:hypothetical protein
MFAPGIDVSSDSTDASLAEVSGDIHFYNTAGTPIPQ